MIAISSDPLLLNWEKSGPLDTEMGDADIWKEGDTYFGLIGGVHSYYPESLVPGENSTTFLGAMYGVGVWPRSTLWTGHRHRSPWSTRNRILEVQVE